MSGRSRSNVALAGLCLAGTLLLGLAVWGVATSQDEPSSAILAVAELEPVDEGPGHARLELVETGHRVWLKIQVRGLPERTANVVLETSTPGDAVTVTVRDDGSYTLHRRDFEMGATVHYVEGSVVVLSGPLARAG